MRDIVGFEGLYAVTSCGKVWSYKSHIFLSQRYDDDGYLRVNLCKDGKTYTKHVHRLVAEAFIPNQESKPQVDHINKEKNANCVPNLRWVTPGENSRHSNLGRKRYWSTIRRPIYCVELDKVYKTQAEACREIGMSSSALNRVLHGKRETCYGYHWKFVKED